MLGIIEEQVKEEKLLHITIMNADKIERAMQLKNMVEHRFTNITELFITEFTPVMGAYTGPGVLAIAYYSGE
jgi:fatty acid-binding protein DegV